MTSLLPRVQAASRRPDRRLCRGRHSPLRPGAARTFSRSGRYGRHWYRQDGRWRRPAVNIEPVGGDCSERPGDAQLVVAVLRALPGLQAGENLSGKGFVDLPVVYRLGAQTPPEQDRRHCVNRAKPHLARFNSRPFAISDPPQHPQSMTLHRLAAGKNQQGGAVGHLGAVAGGNQAEGTVKDRLEFCQTGHIASRRTPSSML